MSERVNLVVDDGVGEMLAELAGGERKRGRYISDLIRAAYEVQATAVPATDVETLRLGLTGLAGTVKGLEGRLLTVEAELAAIIAGNA